MVTAREILQRIEVCAGELLSLDDARLETFRRQLVAIEATLPGRSGDIVCGRCDQRLVIQVRPVTRDAENVHCTRSGNGHVPELV